MIASLPLVILLLIVALLCFLLYYFYIQQSLETMSCQLAQLQAAKASDLGADLVRREKAHHQDQLLLLEASLARSQREFLSDDEWAMVNAAHRSIERCIGALKQSENWLGLPFDLEWCDLLARMPKVIALYRLTPAQASWFEDGNLGPEDAEDVSKSGRTRLQLRLA